jgi:alpha-ketoglutarate-dependent taurine dioxygenase
MMKAAVVQAANKKPHSILSCMPVNQGKQFVVEFGDNTQYELHASWLRDASPAQAGADFYRKSAKDVFSLFDHTIAQVEPSAEGSQMLVKYGGADQVAEDTIESKWLHSLAPFVGKPLNAEGEAKPQIVVKETGSLLDGLMAKRRGWYSDLELPEFHAKDLIDNVDAQIEFIERAIDPGAAIVHGLDAAPGTDMDSAGKPLEDLILNVIGKLNQHPVRRTAHGHMQNTNTTQGADYNHANPLSMHTDHTVYHGTPGFLQFMHQVQASVESKVCDGLAISEYMKEHHPEAYKLLTEVHVTHSSRNNLYTRDGGPRNIQDPNSVGVPFELVHTHPIIQLDANGQLEKIAQSETKRAVCALPYDIYEPYMNAYQLWVKLVEEERFIKKFHWPEGSMIVMNNWRIMHGRASVPSGHQRTMCWGYVNKDILNNRYRYLKQTQMERLNPSMNHRWLTRVPNQALANMVA